MSPRASATWSPSTASRRAFESGLTHVLLGSSGSGKSTILRLILGLISPDSGSIRVDGELLEPKTRRTLLAKMGYVVQEGGLYPHLTARRNVTLAAEARGWDEDRIAARVEELAALVGFDDAILRLHPDEISGGQRQRVGLMRALMLDPPFLLLDEPLGSLDPLVRADLQQQLKEIFTPLGKTVVLVTHDIGEAAVFGHTVTLMTEGRIVQQGHVRRPGEAAGLALRHRVPQRPEAAPGHAGAALVSDRAGACRPRRRPRRGGRLVGGRLILLADRRDPPGRRPLRVRASGEARRSRGLEVVHRELHPRRDRGRRDRAGGRGSGGEEVRPGRDGHHVPGGRPRRHRPLSRVHRDAEPGDPRGPPRPRRSPRSDASSRAPA